MSVKNGTHGPKVEQLKSIGRLISYEMDYLYCAHAFKLTHRKGAKLLAEFHKLLVFICHRIFYNSQIFKDFGEKMVRV